jgi:hypothetical protein
MKIYEHGLRDHIRLLAPLFGFIAAVWALRLVLGVASAPEIALRWISVTLAGAFAIILAVLLIHSRRFGGYPNVVLAAFLLEAFAHLLISAAIAFYAVTGIPNIYTTPEYAHQMTPTNHILAHLTLGIGSGTLFGSAMGCFLLFLLRKLLPVPPVR